MSYEKYTAALVARGYHSLEQQCCDDIVEALTRMGFKRESAYTRALIATAGTVEQADRSGE